MGLLTGLLGGAAGGAAVTIVIKAIDNYSKEFNKLDKNIQKQQTGFQKLTGFLKSSGLGYTMLASAAVGFGVASVKAFIEAESAATAFNAVLGEMADTMLTDLRIASKGLVSDLDLMSSANKALALGIDKNKLPELLKTAAALGKLTGRTVTQAFEDISIGIGRQSRLILDNLGIILDLDAIWKEYEETTGKSADTLDDFTRKQIIANKVIEEGEYITKLMEFQVETTSEKIQRLGAVTKNTAVEFGAWLVSLGDTVIELGKVISASDLWSKDVTSPEVINASIAQLKVWKELKDNVDEAASNVAEYKRQLLSLSIGPFVEIVDKEAEIAQLERDIAIGRRDLLDPLIKEKRAIVENVIEMVARRDEAQKELDILDLRVGAIAAMSLNETIYRDENKKTINQIERDFPIIIGHIDNASLAYENATKATKTFSDANKKAADETITTWGRVEAFFDRMGRVIASIATFGGALIGQPGKLSITGSKKVSDAIIRPNGQIIETDPRDTLIATKGGIGGTIINIENIYGLDPEEISRALSNELNNKLSL